MKKSTIVFDLDGTLLNTIDDLADGVNFVMKKYQYPEYSVRQIQAFVGNGVENLIERSLPDGKNNPFFEDVLKEFKAHYAKISENKTRPYDGVIEMLQKLQDHGVKMAIVSNKFHPAVVRLNEKYFGPYIQLAVGEDSSRRKKPAPDSLYYVLEQLNSSLEETIYVGDSEVDARTAQNSGVDFVAVSWGFRTREELMRHGAEIIIDTPMALLSFFS